MPDEADIGSEVEEQQRQEALASARQGPFDHLTTSGFCLWCGDPVDKGRTHCRPVDNDCAEVHLRYVNTRRGGHHR